MSGWDDLVIPRYFCEFNVPVVVDNDVHLMALSEQEQHYASSDTLVFVKVDSGIGSGIVSRGEIFRGAQGAAGGIGHIQLDQYADVICTCGNRGCLAAVASGAALANRLRAAGTSADTTQDVVDLVRAGHLGAIQVVREAGRDIGRVVAGMVNILNPSAVVIGGALARTDDVLLAGVREVVYRRSPPLATRELRINASLLGDEAGMSGAALLAARHVLSPGYIDAQLGWTSAEASVSAAHSSLWATSHGH
jgi:predicted NBD/HSP70 family sugar kinase